MQPQKAQAPLAPEFEESRAEYMEAMKKYEVDMARFQREGPDLAASSKKEELNLLEMVVRLKSTDGILGASKFRGLQ